MGKYHAWIIDHLESVEDSSTSHETEAENIMNDIMWIENLFFASFLPENLEFLANPLLEATFP